MLTALKKIRDIGRTTAGFFDFITPDDRWSAVCFDHLNTVGITNFEAIQTTSPTQGPRSPGARLRMPAQIKSAFVSRRADLYGVRRVLPISYPTRFSGTLFRPNQRLVH